LPELTQKGGAFCGDSVSGTPVTQYIVLLLRELGLLERGFADKVLSSVRRSLGPPAA